MSFKQFLDFAQYTCLYMFILSMIGMIAGPQTSPECHFYVDLYKWPVLIIYMFVLISPYLKREK